MRKVVLSLVVLALAAPVGFAAEAVCEESCEVEDEMAIPEPVVCGKRIKVEAETTMATCWS